MADGDEAAAELDVFGGTGVDVLRMRTPVTPDLIAQHLVERVEQIQLDLAGLHLLLHLVDHDGLGAEFVAPVDQMHLAGDVDRYSASSTAVLPPPTTQTSWSR